MKNSKGDSQSFIRQYFQKVKTIQENLLHYFETNSINDEDIEILLNDLEKYKIKQSPIFLKDVLILISTISNHHHRSNIFITIVEKIIKAYKEEIKSFYSNFEIFNTFQNNKRILLFLLEEKIIYPDKILASIINNDKYINKGYQSYFYNEFKQFFSPQLIQSIIQNNPEINNYELYQQKRKIGENDDYICQLIRNDSIEEFVIYVNKKSLFLSSTINPSIYETNPFLIQRCPTLIEYSAFYGSIQIFKYLQLNKVPLTSSLWLFAIHGHNSEMIHHLEENHVEPINYSYDKCLKESIKCHHIEFTNYIKNNLIDDKQNTFMFFSDCFKYHNYISIVDHFFSEQNDFKNYENYEIEIFNQACKYDYYEIVDYLIKSNIFDRNEKKPITYDNHYYQYYNSDTDDSDDFDDDDDDFLNNEEGIDDYNGDITVASLYYCSKKGHLDIIKLLVINPNIKIENFYDVKKHYKNTSLHISVENGYIDIVKLLLGREDIQINDKNEKGKTVLHIAIEKENMIMLQYLLERNDINVNLNEITYEDDDTQIKTPLFIAIEKQNVEIIKLLLNQKNIEINAKSEFIHKTVEIQMQKCYGREYDSEYDDYDDFDDYRRKSYRRPCYDDYDEFKMRNDFEIYDYDRFYGTYENYRNMIEFRDTMELNSYYKENRIEHEDRKIKTALHLAVELGNEEIINLLLCQKGIDLNVQDDKCRIPLDLTKDSKIKAVFDKFIPQK